MLLCVVIENPIMTILSVPRDSAKTFAISGLSVIGREKYGVFPLRGKLINPRDANPKQLAENAEFSDLKKIIGLTQGKTYNNARDLRYGSILVLTDAGTL